MTIREWLTHPKRKALGLLMLWAVLWFAIGASCTDRARAHEPLLRQFVQAYEHGDMHALPIDDADARESYAVLFATSAVRSLELRNVRWSDSGRLTADYAATVDGKEAAGSVTMWIENERIARIAHDWTLWPETDSTPALADAGQFADKASTVAGIASQTLTESNPLLSGAGSIGLAGAGLALIGYRQLYVRELALSECIASSRWLGAFGWAGGVNNLVAMTGVGLPVAPILGAIAGFIAYEHIGKADCTDGPVRIARLP